MPVWRSSSVMQALACKVEGMSRGPANAAGEVVGLGSGSGPRVLTLTTDFGTRDHYVGTMKGVVAGICPRATVVDITHEVPAFDIAEGAFAIAQAFRYFPDGTVHVVVVDPGVGSSRRAIAVRAGPHFFIAPDNGVLSQVVEGAGSVEVRRIDWRHGLQMPSRTFHGRDLFAPAGARLLAGLPFAEIGPKTDAWVRLPSAVAADGVGQVLHVDVFGNLVTSFRSEDFPAGAGLEVAGDVITARSESYASMPDGLPCLIDGSSGFVEIAVNQDSAAEILGASAGRRVGLKA